ncbi:type I-C CRISPR-associated protein Cas7/Csd2 [Clostridium algidicarnis]|uniref:type I-C CRISPR-associated protein Cas7/Csd2 n=1 Tax=Clostridium algidicarnis TaxID=37659 RepID=UPI00162AD55E|nr:type I-C CRISPR-associated protein Cas7/Csd2 [Clostridium algidicarnis]MBB6696543.1 type I-C CRISPR-associated protein Cas7/Csd2 [Clostridium algidicarnis]
MSNFVNKIDFAVIISAKNANPNGDPLNGNRPRENYDGYGEISDVCIKRKIRNRLQDMGKEIFVQSDERRTDGFRSLKDRADGCAELKKSIKDKEQYAKIACDKWIDVRSFGQVFAFKKGEEDNSVSVGIRGPVSIHSAVSISPIEISSMQITKSVNGETQKDPDKKGSDTMGMKHRIEFGVYVIYGSINTQLATKTGFSEDDSELIKEALITLFENDCSSARPDGSMEVCKLYWWKHNAQMGQYSSAKVHRSLQIVPSVQVPRSINDYNISLETLDELTPEIYDGI